MDYENTTDQIQQVELDEATEAERKGVNNRIQEARQNTSLFNIPRRQQLSRLEKANNLRSSAERIKAGNQEYDMKQRYKRFMNAQDTNDTKTQHSMQKAQRALGKMGVNTEFGHMRRDGSMPEDKAAIVAHMKHQKKVEEQKAYQRKQLAKQQRADALAKQTATAGGPKLTVIKGGKASPSTPAAAAGHKAYLRLSQAAGK